MGSPLIHIQVSIISKFVFALSQFSQISICAFFDRDNINPFTELAQKYGAYICSTDDEGTL